MLAGARPLPRAFYARGSTVVARALLGRTLVRETRRGPLAGVIVEVEAYGGGRDPASHAWRGETPRNRVMFGPPGFAYVYRSYGIHWCANFVCEAEGSASAVLIRAIEPTHGLAVMRRRRGADDVRALCSGPGKLCEALAITGNHSGLPLDRQPFALHARLEKPEIAIGIRIGITKAAELPWRYGLKGSRFLSKPFTTTS